MPDRCTWFTINSWPGQK